MRVACILILAPLLLAEPERVELRYKFTKGMVSHLEQTQTFLQEVFAETRIVRWKIETEIVLDRTVLQVDDDAQPTIERVEVKKWLFKTIEHPEKDAGEQSDMAQGQTFVWREIDGSRRLFAEGDRDVTEQLPALVQLLAGWRKARLPENPIAVGDTWEVDAQRFFEASGMPSTEGTRGRAVFKLERLAEGVAEIGFDMTFSREDAGMLQGGQATGTMRFDARKGRDLSSRMKGRVQFDNGNKGFAEIGLERTITYPEGG